jgi:hypothetical protein
VNGLQNNPHFWRGVIDGDGCLSFTRKGFCSLNLSGAQPLLEQFAEFIHEIIPGYLPRVRPTQSIYAVVIGGQYAYQIIHHLYAGAHVALPRKLFLARSILAHQRCLPF